MNALNNTFSIEQINDMYLSGHGRTKGISAMQDVSFQEILKKQAEYADNDNELKFSKHASQRLSDRNISLSQDQNERLLNGVEKADEKGIKDSLVLIDSLAFIVNVPNKTVITTMDQNEADENIFTNIDGAVIM